MNVARPMTTPLKLAALFVLLTGAVLGAIGWLGWQLLAQERVLEERRLHDRLDMAANAVAGDLDRDLAAWEAQLSAFAGGKPPTLPAGVAAVAFDAHGVVRRAGVSLPFYPRVPPVSESASDRFAEGERLEFERQDLASAERLYRRMAETPDPGVQAAALIRVARTLRRRGRIRDAIAVYDRLAAIGATVWVAGAPAELIARHERVVLRRQLGETEEADREADQLAAVLSSGRLIIDRDTYEFYGASAPRRAPPDAAYTLATALDTLWPTIERQRNGRTAIAVAGSSLTALWHTSPAGSAALIGPVSSVIPALKSASGQEFRLDLEAEDGRMVWGVRDEGPSVFKTARETGLPWALRLTGIESGAAHDLIRSRRLLQTIGFVLMALVVMTAGMAIFRALMRELAVARVQSEFVATVSHEFRTPLTAMRHLAEMLDAGEAPHDRLPQYYSALVKETCRLQSLVERLLDFGRLEAGRPPYRFEPVDPVELVRQVLGELGHSPSARRLRLEANTNSDETTLVFGDRQAISLAIRNLVDNALKYSPDSAAVRVVVDTGDKEASIAVIDLGPGIQAGERRTIVRRFVRGSAAADLRVKGTGIGLAIVDRVVHAHGGRLRVESEPGRGSTFRITLPVMKRRRGVEARRAASAVDTSEPDPAGRVRL